MSTTGTPFAGSSHLFVEAIRRRDTFAACAVYADDARLLPPLSGEISGRTEIQAFWEAGLNSGMTDVSFEAIDVRSDEAMATEAGRYTFSVEPADSARVTERGHYVHIHARQPDGSWRRVVEIFTPGGSE